MDGDRSMADRRDIFKSRVQEIIHDAWWGGWWDNQSEHRFGEWPPEKRKERVKTYLEMFDFALSYLDDPSGNVGPQDETSEARAVGDSIRSKTYLKGTGIQTCVFDDLDSDLCQSIMNKRSKQISEAAKKALLDYSDSLFNGCIETVETMDDGTIDVRTRYF